ncbi:MAG TPA: antitoxin Xre/MbcA/ParS toxin-binding domain-containing protein [Gemmatimonadales bacterium]|nr:antitoxin Xre/MbcA/ParS toxin-binding domain-containing protein [Gemmatimonadales bacterium]
MTAAVVAERMGGYPVLRKHVASDLDLAALVRAGLPAAALDHLLAELAEGGSPVSDVYRVVGSARTLQRKRTQRARLSVDESDRLARLARLVVRAEEALGDRTNAVQWLIRANRALGGNRPLALLDSDAGARAVEQVLGRIEYGVYS